MYSAYLCTTISTVVAMITSFLASQHAFCFQQILAEKETSTTRCAIWKLTFYDTFLMGNWLLYQNLSRQLIVCISKNILKYEFYLVLKKWLIWIIARPRSCLKLLLLGVMISFSKLAFENQVKGEEIGQNWSHHPKFKTLFLIEICMVFKTFDRN